MPKPRKGDPELLLVSFCDIVTITTAAMFMAMIVVIDQVSRIPVLRATPVAEATTNTPVYFECRNNQVFFINRQTIEKEVQTHQSDFAAQAAAASLDTTTSMTNLMAVDWGDETYRVMPNYLLMGMIALEPRTNAPAGITEEEMYQSSSNAFRTAIQSLATNSYVVFIVRDDSFPVFRRARETVDKSHLTTGWEYLGRDEPLAFVGMFSHIKTQ